MIPPPPYGPELFGPLLVRLRTAHGWSQAQLAARLGVAAGTPTLSRHEISRWERQVRLPGEFWLGWLAVVLSVPRDRLAGAVGASRAVAYPLPEGARARRALLALAQRWLADPDTPLLPAGPPRRGSGRDDGGLTDAASGERDDGGLTDDASERDDGDPVGWLDRLRRLDDLSGGADLVGLGNARLARVSRAVARAGPSRRRRLLPVLAETAQLAGWLAADAGDPAAGLAAYRLGLRAASAAGDRALAGHVLGSASHLLGEVGDAHGALLLARVAYAGAAPVASTGLRALLLHRHALAAALDGRHRSAGRALAAAERTAERHDPGREPPWLYWLDPVESAAMTGRTWAVLGRPMRAEPLLRAGLRPGQPRTTALYGAWLARAWLALGEVEQAGVVAGEAALAAVRAGSVRATGQLAEVGRRLATDRTDPGVRRHAALLDAARPYLPRRVTPPAVHGRGERPASVDT